MGKQRAKTVDLSRVSATVARRIEWFSEGKATGRLTIDLHFRGGRLAAADFATNYRMLPDEVVRPEILDALMGRDGADGKQEQGEAVDGIA